MTMALNLLSDGIEINIRKVYTKYIKKNHLYYLDSAYGILLVLNIIFCQYKFISFGFSLLIKIKIKY